METIQEHAVTGPSQQPQESLLASRAGARGQGGRPRSRAAPLADVPPMAAAGGTLAVAGIALSAALLRLTGAHRRRVRCITGQLQEREAKLAELSSQLADANKRVEALRSTAGGEAEVLRQELDAAKASLAERGEELSSAKEAFEQRITDLEAMKAQLSSALASNSSDTEAAAARCADAEAARAAAEERWRAAYDELLRTKQDLESARGELGLTRSQMLGLERELERTQKQLHNSEKRAEQAAFDYRTSRLSSARSDDTYSMWD